MHLLRPIATLTLILGFAAEAIAQSDEGTDSSGGVQSTLGEFVSDAFDDLGTLYQEAVRLYWLSNSDITMWMTAHDEGTGDGGEGEERVGPFDMFILREAPSDSSLYAEFDWDNLAMSMRARDSGNESSVEFHPLGAEIDTSAEPTDITMYFDSSGTVYVPTGTGGYVTANLGDMVSNSIDVFQVPFEIAINYGVAEMLDNLLGYAAIGMDDMSFGGGIPEPLIDAFEEYAETAWNNETQSWEYTSESGILEDRLREILENLMRVNYQALSVFPLVNFSILYSPTAVRSFGGVAEESTSWLGQPGGTRFTVASGSDAGYVIAFDQFNRLVLLRDSDGNTARYA